MTRAGMVFKKIKYPFSWTVVTLAQKVLLNDS